MKHVRWLQFIETPAEAQNMALAALVLTGKTGQWILHEPDIFTALDGA
jgi:hypothetical protein